MDLLSIWLKENSIIEDEFAIAHGDYRLGNTIIDKNNSTVIGVLDWELSTLAPPFIDLSYWCLMLRFETDWLIPGLGQIRDNSITEGIPKEKELLQLYADALGYDVGKSWNFLLAFNCFRFAGIYKVYLKDLKTATMQEKTQTKLDY